MRAFFLAALLHFLFPPLFSAFLPTPYLEAKGYRGEPLDKKGHFSFYHPQKKVKITLKIFQRFFQVQEHLYAFRQPLTTSKRGIVLVDEDKTLFQAVIAYYENKNQPPKATIDKVIPTNPSQPKAVTIPPNKKATATSSQVPLLRPYVQLKKAPKMTYLILDPGHGGRDPGATFYGFLEKDLVLQLTKRLQKILLSRTKGIRVLLTRRDDSYLSLEERATFANELLDRGENALFLSIHLNVWFNPDTRGLEVYYLPHDLQVILKRANSHLENLQLQTERAALLKVLSYLEVVQYQKESRFIARAITESVFSEVSSYPVERGVKAEFFYVLKGVLMPAVLLELGFISNREDLSFLLDDEKSTRLLTSVARAVVAYIDAFHETAGFTRNF